MRRAVVLFALIACGEEALEEGGACDVPDQDGVVGGAYTFDVEVKDDGFMPAVLKAQNSGTITLTLRNTGTKPHGFEVQCRVVQGCTSCFPDASKIAVEPGATRTVTFTAPEEEGIFPVRSPGDTFEGQFILQ